MSKKQTTSKPEYPKIVETFLPVGEWELSRYRDAEPSAFNGSVRVRRYRITVELIDEPKEVISERLEQLWVTCDNWHYYEPLKFAAKNIGYEFKGRFGESRDKSIGEKTND